MTRLVSRFVPTVIALAVAAWLVAGIRFSGPTSGQAEIEHKIVPLLVVAAILTVVTSFVKPVLTLLSIPFIILTLGLFLLVINAALLLLTSALADALDIGFTVDTFGAALIGALLITIVTWIVDGFVGEDD